MIRHIIAWSIKNRFLIFILTLFLIVWGIWSIKRMPLDALPDLSDTQVIIYTEWMGRSPDQIENQITYPLTTTLLATPQVKTVRGFSYPGSSFVYVIFKDGTDLYWARNRVLEYLQTAKKKLPVDVNPVLGPDATSLGWGFSYALIDTKGKHNLAQLRSLQDWNIKLALESVPGVAQVASVGGFVKEYQISVDANRLRLFNLTIMDMMEAVRRSNNEVEGRFLEVSGFEYMIRGRGYLKNTEDLKNIRVSGKGNTPVYLKDVATVQLGPALRRGVTDLNGKGEVVGGIVIVRFGENVLNVIKRVKEKINTEIAPGLPDGVKIEVTYDRTELIHRSINTLTEELIKLAIAVSIVCAVFLWHWPSIFVIICTLPIAILMAFIAMYYMGITANIMSLSGIAIAIGAMVDAAIIIVENTHKKLEEWEKSDKTTPRIQVIIDAATEVGPSLFFSLLVITVGFLPIFSFQAQAGRLFKPLAFTKTFSMLFASFLAITLTPALLTVFMKGKMVSEDQHVISRILHQLYSPVVSFALKFKKTIIVTAILLLLATLYPIFKISSEFMPPLFEGTLFYMPVTSPGISIAQSTRLLKLQDQLIKKVPEVDSVFGKAGRAQTATDPAPLDMFETIINLKPPSQWRKGLTIDDIQNELNSNLMIPGVANAFTMPIKARIDMLATGIKTPVGIKIMGADPATIEQIGLQIEKQLSNLKGTRSVYSERLTNGYYLDIVPNPNKLAQYGLQLDDVQTIISTALGGMTITTTIEGRERYDVTLRYARELRNDIDKIRQIPVPIKTMAPSDGMSNSNLSTLAQVPLGELADIHYTRGPMGIKSEQGKLTSYVYIDLSRQDIGSYISEAKTILKKQLILPAGYSLQWSGEYEYMEATKDRLMAIIPLTALIIFCLIFINTRSLMRTLIVLLAVPFSLIGSFWFLYILGYNLSAAVWVGLIALAGLDAETGIVMLLYLDLAYEKWKKEGRLTTINGLKEAIMFGAVKRIRPKLMTVGAAFIGLVPIMFSYGTGADVMKRIAAPMIGGLLSSFILELVVYPVIYLIWREKKSS